MSLPNPIRLGTPTAGELITNSRNQLKEYTEEMVAFKTWLALFNEATWEYNEVAGNKDSELYKENIPLIIYQEGGVAFHPAGSPNANYKYTQSGKKLSLGPNGAGISEVSWENDVYGMDSTWIGAQVFLMKVAGGVNNIVIDSIESIPSQVVEYGCVLKNGYGSDIASTELKGFIVKANTISNGYIYLGAIDGLIQRIDKITSLEDSLNGPCSLKAERDFLGIIKANDPNTEFSDQIVYFRQGNYIRISKGSEVTNYGDLTLNYIRKSIPMAAKTDKIDVVDGAIRTIKDMVMIKVLQITKQPIPTQFANTEAGKILKVKQANAEEKAAIKNKQD